MRGSVQTILIAALTMGLALPAMAQVMGPPFQGGPMGAQGPGAGFGRRGEGLSHEGPLITIMLDHKQDLGLTLDQERRLRDLRTEFEKEAVRRTAEIRVAEIELGALLEQDKWDLAKIESKVKQIAALQGDLRFSRIKTLEAGRAVLTPQQLEGLKQIGHRMRPDWGPGGFGPGTMAPGQTPGPGMPGPGRPGPGGSGAPR
jgi:Spy/CpxP family protein refolding chaperone